VVLSLVKDVKEETRASILRLEDQPWHWDTSCIKTFSV